MEYKIWLKNKHTYYRKLPVFVFMIFFITTVVIPFFKNYGSIETVGFILAWLGEEKNYRMLGHVLQALFICFVFFTMQGEYHPIGYNKGTNLKEYILARFGKDSQLAKANGQYLERGVNKNLRQFYQLWQTLWGTWFIIYSLYSCERLFVDDKTKQFEDWFIVLIDVLNITTSILLLFMYRILAKRTVKRTTNGAAKSDIITGKILGLIIPFILIDILIYSLVKDASTVELFRFVFRFVIGIFASIGFMALLGKLNSPFINIPTISIVILYGYAAIQMLYPFDSVKISTVIASEKQLVNTILTSFAFICKIGFFLTLSWIMESGRLTYFIICESNLVREEKKCFELFESREITKDS